MVQRFKVNIEDICAFCKITPETIKHLFWECPKTQMFWKELCFEKNPDVLKSNYLQSKVMILVNFEEIDVMLKGFSFEGDKNLLFIFDLIVIFPVTIFIRSNGMERYQILNILKLMLRYI